MGSGAYGDVWLARGITGSYCAIKIVWRERFPDADPYDREFRGVSDFAPISLLDRGQLAILHVGENRSGGFFYYVMELADDAEAGRVIDPARYVPRTLKEEHTRRGRIPAAECVTLSIELASSLAFLHAQNLVHRDIKPSNIVFVGGVSKLADVGLVSASSSTSTYVGTEGFVAPEGPGAPGADIFALGKVMYEITTGLDRKKFPRLPPDLDRLPDRAVLLALNPIILRACDPDPQRRFRNAEELRAALEEVLRTPRGLRAVRRRWMKRVAAGAAIAATIAAGVAWYRGRQPVAVRPPEHSIAVLPFEHAGDDAHAPWIAAGMQDDVMAKLSKIAGIRVLPRASVAAYLAARKQGKPVEGVSVAHVIDGTVRVDGEHVRVTAAMIDTRSDRTEWAETYDSVLKDVFAIQSDAAQKIASALQVTISQHRREQIARPPTGSETAYEYFVQARSMFRTLGESGVTAQYEPILELLERALREDPNFALAYVEVSLVNSTMYQYSHIDPSPERLQKARAAAARALHIASDLPELKIALGVIAFEGVGDWAQALEYFRAAEGQIPNDSKVHLWIGRTLQQLGRWSEAVDEFKTAFDLEPSALCAGYEVRGIQTLRQFKELEPLATKLLARFPNHRRMHYAVAFSRFELDGDRAAFLQRMIMMPSNPEDPGRLMDQYMDALRREDWVEADRALADRRIVRLSDPGDQTNMPIELDRAFVAFCTGDTARARQFAEPVIDYYGGRPWMPRQQRWALLGKARAEAYSGRLDEGFRDAHAALTAAEKHGAVEFVQLQPYVAQVYVACGRRAEALDLLRQMMRGPSYWGPNQIRWDPILSRLKDNPQFEEILRSARPL